MTATTSPSCVSMIEQRLADLQAQIFEIVDDSAAHQGHVGAADGGGHYQLHLVSDRFEGLSRLARHRLVYDRLADLIPHQIHALTLDLRTLKELGL